MPLPGRPAPAFYQQQANFPPQQQPQVPGYPAGPTAYGPTLHFAGPAPLREGFPPGPREGHLPPFSPAQQSFGQYPAPHQPGPGIAPALGPPPNDMSRYYDDRRPPDNRSYDDRRGFDDRRRPQDMYRPPPRADTYRPGPPMPHQQHQAPHQPPLSQQPSYGHDRYPPPQAQGRYPQGPPPPRNQQQDRYRPVQGGRSDDMRRLQAQPVPSNAHDGRPASHANDRRPPIPDERGSPAKRPRLEESQPVARSAPIERGRASSTDSEPPLYDRGGPRSRSRSPPPRSGRGRSRSPDRSRRRRSRSRDRSRSPDSDRGGRYFDRVRRSRSRSRSRSPARRRRTRSPSPRNFKMPDRSKAKPNQAPRSAESKGGSAAGAPAFKGNATMRKFFPGEELDEEDSPKKTMIVDHPFLSPPRAPKSKVQPQRAVDRPDAIDVDAQPDLPPSGPSRGRDASHQVGSRTPSGPAHAHRRSPPPSAGNGRRRSRSPPPSRADYPSYPPPRNGHDLRQDVYHGPPPSYPARNDSRSGPFPQQPPTGPAGQYGTMPPPAPQGQPRTPSSLPARPPTGPASRGGSGNNLPNQPRQGRQPLESPSSASFPAGAGVPTTATGSPAVPPPGRSDSGPRTPVSTVPASPAEPASAISASRSTEYYERVEQVGEGTYGKVYKARSIEDGTFVALKMIRMDAEKDGFPVTAVREIKLLQSLRHQNVVELKEMMVSRGHVHMVFEYVDHDLTGVLRHPNIKFTPAHLKSMMAQLLCGLEYIHRRGVLHRDLKGSNILVSRSGEMKIADFGLARFYARDARNDYTNRVITQWYKPPELLFGATVYGASVDVWSAGCIFLELFAGRPAFQGNDEIHQLDVIFRIMGTPDAASWPAVSELPWFELVKPKKVQPNRLREAYAKYISTPETFACAEALLTLNPDRRVSAADALKLPYFVDEDPKPEMPSFLSTIEGDWHEWEAKRKSKRKSTAEEMAET